MDSKLMIAGLYVVVGLLLGVSYFNHLRLVALEDLHKRAVAEDVFLGGKLEELKFLTEKETELQRLQVDLAVAGFRTGDYSLYEAIVLEARLSGLLGEAYEHTQQ